MSRKSYEQHFSQGDDISGKMLYFRTLLIIIGAHYEKISWYMTLIQVHHITNLESLKLRRSNPGDHIDKPIQVRINGGPWIDVRQSDPITIEIARDRVAIQPFSSSPVNPGIKYRYDIQLQVPGIPRLLSM